MNGSIEYSVPQRGSVTRQCATDLYHVKQSLELNDNFNVTSALIGVLLDDDLKKLATIPAIAIKATVKATYKQMRALNRIIYGKHYTVKTYLEVMDTLVNLESIRHADNENNGPSETVSSIGKKEEMTEEVNEENPPEIFKDVDPIVNNGSPDNWNTADNQGETVQSTNKEHGPEVSPVQDRRQEDQDPAFFYNEKVLPFLHDLAQGLKAPNMADHRGEFVNELLAIAQEVK